MDPDCLCDLRRSVTNCSHSEREFKIMSAMLPWICDLPQLVTGCSHSEQEFKIMSAVLPWIRTASVTCLGWSPAAPTQPEFKIMSTVLPWI